MHGCTNTEHIWTVTADCGRLNTSHLRHGHACKCGNRVIAMVECDHGCRHKTVVTKQQFDRAMKEKG